MKLTPHIVKFGLVLAAGALAAAGAQAQTKPPGKTPADPTARGHASSKGPADGAEAAGAAAANPAAPRPGKMPAGPSNAGERALPPAPGTGAKKQPAGAASANPEKRKP